MIKVPAAKLIELAGLKGARRGDAGISPKHALIVQNFGSATGKDLFEFSEHVIERVAEMFGITLEREVNRSVKCRLFSPGYSQLI